MTAKNIIDLVGLGDTVGIKNAIEAAIQEKVAERLENMKIDLVNQTFNESSHEDEDDDEYKKSKKKSENDDDDDDDDEDEEDDDDLDEESQANRQLKAKQAAERSRLKAKERRDEFRKKEIEIKKKENEKVDEGYYSSKPGASRVQKIIDTRRRRERIDALNKSSAAQIKQRAAAKAAEANKKKVSENSQIDELSNKTLSSYIKKATDREEEEHTRGLNKATARIIKNRLADKGASKSSDRLSK